ncbi:MAG: hypothetical protein K8L97_28475 [Anaerolineae bacterium]|nr:hypothetical protein [Anaerolineae bacterium]
MNQQNRYGHADADIAMEIAHLMDELHPHDPNRPSLLGQLMAKLRRAEPDTTEAAPQPNGRTPQTARYEV